MGGVGAFQHLVEGVLLRLRHAPEEAAVESVQFSYHRHLLARVLVDEKLQLVKATPTVDDQVIVDLFVLDELLHAEQLAKIALVREMDVVPRSERVHLLLAVK